MIEYELFTRILSRDFLSPNQQMMKEPKQAGVHTCDIINKAVDDYKVYRYDLDKCNFLPFFNNKHDDAKKGIVVNNPTLAGLLMFCDYILLAAVKEKLYFILVEMKSGSSAKAKKQLEASRVFIDFVIASAKRIKDSSGYDDFDCKNIILRKVLLKPAPKSRPITNLKKRYSQIDWSADTIELKQSTFPLLQVCECRRR